MVLVALFGTGRIQPVGKLCWNLYWIFKGGFRKDIQSTIYLWGFGTSAPRNDIESTVAILNICYRWMEIQQLPCPLEFRLKYIIFINYSGISGATSMSNRKFSSHSRINILVVYLVQSTMKVIKCLRRYWRLMVKFFFTITIDKLISESQMMQKNY